MNEERDKTEYMLDSMNKPITMGLFLELEYSRFAIYSLKERDCEYEGRIYPSIKRLYMETGDPTEYQFASKYFLNWKHWMRICDNKILRKYIDEWREELEVKLRSQAVSNMLTSARSGNYQACKWLADRGWHTRGAGRPSKAEVDREKKIQAAVNEEYAGDVIRLFESK